MSLTEVQGKLSRAEMKNVMAGSGSTGCENRDSSNCEGTPCTGSSNTGKCVWSNKRSICQCATAF